jgi:hypothetical protein
VKNKTPEQTCKFCGGFLNLYKCENPPCKLYGREFRASDKTTFCQACDELLAFKTITNPCPDCLKNEPDTLLKRFQQSDKDALKAELGYTHEVEWCVFTEDAGLVVGEKWQGYMLEILGIVLGRFSEWRIPDESIDFYERVGAITRTSENRVLLKPSLLLPFTCIPSPEDSDLIIKLCRIRARYEGSPLYSEMRAHPYGVRRVAIHGFQYKHTEKDFERAVKGLDLLRKADRNLRGRPKGSTKPEEKKAQEAAEYEKKVEAAIRKLITAKGKMPTKKAVAKELGIGGLSAGGTDSTLTNFGRKLRGLKIDYDAIVERIKVDK